MKQLSRESPRAVSGFFCSGASMTTFPRRKKSLVYCAGGEEDPANESRPLAGLPLFLHFPPRWGQVRLFPQGKSSHRPLCRQILACRELMEADPDLSDSVTQNLANLERQLRDTGRAERDSVRDAPKTACGETPQPRRPAARRHSHDGLRRDATATVAPCALTRLRSSGWCGWKMRMQTVIMGTGTIRFATEARIRVPAPDRFLFTPKKGGI